MTDIHVLCTQMTERFPEWITSTNVALGELTVEVKPQHLHDLCLALRDQPDFDYKLLLDVCGVDYLRYGLDDWQTFSATETGFGRGVTSTLLRENPAKPNRFAVVYHLLSLTKNHRIRLRVNIPDEADSLLILS